MKKIIFLTIMFFYFTSNTLNDNLNINQVNQELITDMENTYNIKINNASKEFPNFKITKDNNVYQINNALQIISKILSKFNKEFFNTFYKYNYNGLNIYLTNNIVSEDQITPSGLSLDYQKNYILALNINASSLEKVFCHELMHHIEFNMQKESEPFPLWNTYNPPNFYYNYSYTKDYIFNYTLNDPQKNIYFIDYYAHTYPEEDRARIFENICAYQTNLSYYPHIYQKALYLQKEILNIYPSLSSLFKL